MTKRKFTHNLVNEQHKKWNICTNIVHTQTTARQQQNYTQIHNDNKTWEKSTILYRVLKSQSRCILDILPKLPVCPQEFTMIC